MGTLSLQELLEVIENKGVIGRKSPETQMYYLNKSRGFAIVSCDNKGQVVSAFCKINDRINNFVGADAASISDICKKHFTEEQLIPYTKPYTR